MPKSLNYKISLALVAVLACAGAQSAAAVDALIKPVPSPDLSRVPAAAADDLKQTRAEFDKIKGALIGDPLVQAYALLGGAYARAGLYDAAAVALEDAALLAPKDSRWVYAQGIVARAQNQPAAAQGYFDQALTLNNDYLPIRLAAANSRIDRGDFDGARKILSEYTTRHGDKAAPFALLGDIALKQRRYPEAIDQLDRALKAEPKATSLYARLAEAYAASGDAKAAADARAKAGNVAPEIADPLGASLIAGMAANAAKAAAPASTDPVTRSVDEAVFMLSAHQYDAAREKLDTALKAKPNDAVLLAMYSRVEAAAGNLPAARSRAAAAVAADSNNALAYLSQGVAAEMDKDDAAAQRAYEKAISLRPEMIDARQRLANLLLRTARFVPAADQYRQVLRLEPNDRESWARLVAANVGAGQCAAALKDINDGLAKQPAENYLLQLFVRLASTCPAANAEEKRMALDYGGKLYRENDAAQIGEAYALALAAAGKWDDAVKTQQAAMFVLVRNNVRGELPAYRTTLEKLQAHKLPDRPWADSSHEYRPLRPAPDPKPVAKPAASTPPPKK